MCTNNIIRFIIRYFKLKIKNIYKKIKMTGVRLPPHSPCGNHALLSIFILFSVNDNVNIDLSKKYIFNIIFLIVCCNFDLFT